jgi:hypothetical protein
MVQLSVAASLGLVMILFLLPRGSDVSLAQISLSPSCTIIDPITGLCQTITSLLSPTATITSTSTPTVTTTSSSPTSTTSPSTSSSSTSGGTTTTTLSTATSKLLGSATAPFGSAAYGPGGLFSGGNFGGGTTYFAPNGQVLTSRRVYFQSAFGAPVSKEVATAAVDSASIESAPVASAVTHVPRIFLMLFPLGFAVLSLVTCLVLEVNEGGAGAVSVPVIRRGI